MANRKPHLRYWLVAAAWAVAVPDGLTQAPGDLLRLTTDDLLGRAAGYVRRFEKSMSTVVLEERYVQIIKPWTLPPKQPDMEHLAWLEDVTSERPDVIVTHRRQTKSDLLIVQAPHQRWTAFRDTYEVNGRQQSHREDRLRKLFLEGSEDSRRQLRRIHQRSAEWNLGGFYREINLPTIGLVVLHPDYQQRFAFVAEGMAQVGSIPCRIVSFKETAKPTLVRSLRERDIPLSGHACIDAAGAVWSTWVSLDERYTTRGSIDVKYQPHGRADVLVPERMWEWYLLPGPDERGLPIYVEAMARYSNLRQFTVTTKVK